MGFTSVKIDVDARSFTAISPYASITTEEIQNFGKVLRFEGDMLAIYRDIMRRGAKTLRSRAPQISGRLSFGSLRPSKALLPVQIVIEAIISQQPTEEYDSKVENMINDEEDDAILSRPRREASSFQQLVGREVQDEISMFISPIQIVSVLA
jgi:hypothetical protein